MTKLHLTSKMKEELIKMYNSQIESLMEDLQYNREELFSYSSQIAEFAKGVKPITSTVDGSNLELHLDFVNDSVVLIKKLEAELQEIRKAIHILEQYSTFEFEGADEE